MPKCSLTCSKTGTITFLVGRQPYLCSLVHSVLARICLFFQNRCYLKGVICKTRELFFSAKNVPLCAQISRTMPPSKHLRNMRGPYLSTEPLNNKCSSPINCALPPLCATIYYVHIMEHIQHNIRYTYSRNYRAYIPAGHNQ